MNMDWLSNANRKRGWNMKNRIWILAVVIAAGLALSGCSCNDIGYCPQIFPKPN